MNRQQFQNQLKSTELKGQSKLSTFKLFYEYQNTCSDPQNIIRYMEEVAICTFLPQFWILKAELMAERGQYSLCFQYMKEAKSMHGITDQQTLTMSQIQEKIGAFEKNLKEQIIRSNSNKKRSIVQFKIQSEPESVKNIDSLLDIYNANSVKIKLEKDKIYELKRQKLPKSCFFDKYQQIDKIKFEIQQKCFENSMRMTMTQSVRCQSLCTPNRARNLVRFKNALDSVELKRRKSNKQQIEKTTKTQSIKQDQELTKAIQQNQHFDISQKLVYSLPVGRKFKQQKRVTFSNIPSGIQKLRCADTHLDSIKIAPETSDKKRKNSIIKFKLSDRTRSNTKSQQN